MADGGMPGAVRRKLMRRGARRTRNPIQLTIGDTVAEPPLAVTLAKAVAGPRSLQISFITSLVEHQLGRV